MSINVYKWKDANLPDGKNAVVCNIDADDCKGKEVINCGNENGIHHIQLIDTSGSMSYDLPQLIEDLKLVINNMNPKDFFSVIRFSSEGNYEVILKGISRNVGMSTLYKYYSLLDNYKKAGGCTSFVGPVNESQIVANDLMDICENVVITLFTDGEPVSSINDEYSEVSKLIESMKDNIIAFNTIGYGNYYNKGYLIGWSQMSNFGVFNHASEIDEYIRIFDNNYEIVKGLHTNKVDFDVPEGTKIYYITSSNAQILPRNNINYLKLRNQFIIVYDEDFKFKVNDKEYDTSEVESEVRLSWINGYYYKIAYAEYKAGNRKESLSVLFNNLHDKNLIDNNSHSFTNDECLIYEKLLKKSAFYVTFRNPNTCSSNYLPDENSPCLLGVLELLFEDGKSMYDYKKTEYSRIGRKVTDNFNMFIPETNTIVPLDDIVFNEGEGKLNISLRFIINGYVNINPRQAEKVNIDPHYKSSIFRNHTIIKDGNLNINEITVYVTDETYKKISDYYSGVIAVYDTINNYNGLNRMVLCLDNLPIINASYGNIPIRDIYELVLRKITAKSYNKVYKYYANKIIDGKTIVDSSNLSADAYKLLSEYGIKNGIYSGIDNSIDNKEDCDIYFARTLKFSLKGFSSLSSVESAMKKPKNGDIFMTEAIKLCEEKNYSKETLMNFIKENKKAIKHYDTVLCGCKIAKILTGDWFDDLERTKDPNKFVYKKADIDMNVTLNKVKCYVSNE